MIERGAIRNRALAMRVRDYTGLRFGKITPTDIDGFMEFGGRLFVFIEGKSGSANMPYGQQLALERLTDAVHKPPERYAICLISKHNDEGDIDAANSRLTRYRWNGRWSYVFKDISLRFAIDRLVAKYARSK
jgi:hypothetical protein